MAPVCVRVAFVGGGPGGLRAGPDRMGRIALRGGRPGLLRTKTEKLRGGMRGFGSARRRDAWGGVGLRWRTRGGSKAFSESSVPICDTRGRSGPKVSKRREPGGNRQSEGTKAKPRKPNDSNGFRGSNPGGGYEIRTREAVTPTRFPSVRHRPLGEFSNYATLCNGHLQNAT